MLSSIFQQVVYVCVHAFGRIPRMVFETFSIGETIPGSDPQTQHGVNQKLLC